MQTLEVLRTINIPLNPIIHELGSLKCNTLRAIKDFNYVWWYYNFNDFLNLMASVLDIE